MDLWIDFLINRWHEATLMDYAHLIMAVILVGWGMTRARGW